jgi:8-oxo-dGTP diphosphatase
MLVIRRSRWVRAPRTICFPGGGILDGESEPETLVRECQEEIGVRVRPLRRLWQCMTRWNVCLGWWLASMDADASPVANPAEVEEVLWVTPDEMAEMADVLESNREFLRLVSTGQIRLEENAAGEGNAEVNGEGVLRRQKQDEMDT